MNLKIDTSFHVDKLLQNDEIFTKFINFYFTFDNQELNNKYKLNELAVDLHTSLHLNNIYEFNVPNEKKLTCIKKTKEKKLNHTTLKKRYSVYTKALLTEKILKKFKLNFYHNYKNVYFNKVKVKVKESNKLIVKSFSFYNINNNYAYLSILNEIILQYYAYLLMYDYSQKNNVPFYVPKLYKIEKSIDKNYNVKIKIYMQYIHCDQQDNVYIENNYKEINEQINNALLYLQQFSLYHNDTHIENIILNKEDKSITLIDFGQASIHENYYNSEYSFVLNSNNKDHFRNWYNKKKTYFNY